MIVSEHIVIGESIRHNANQILEEIQSGEKYKNIICYAVTTSFEEDSLMYVLSAVEFRQPFYHKGSLRLLGLAGSRKEAYEIVLNLVQEGYNRDSIHQMKQYLENI